jgi:hypothetical protein
VYWSDNEIVFVTGDIVAWNLSAEKFLYFLPRGLRESSKEKEIPQYQLQ